MPITPTYPGVYIQELPSGVRTITGVSTAVALFIGRAKQGPLDEPVLCLNYSDFVRTFAEDSSLGNLARQVRLFFANGGTQCYVLRIAHAASSASVTLKSEANVDVLVLTAKNAGLIGETVRAAVTYDGPQPEATFSLEVFRWDATPTGQLIKADQELWPNLSMDPSASRYAVDFLTQNSNLVKAALPGALSPSATGFSQSGRPVPYVTATPGTMRTAWASLLGTTGASNQFQISVDGTPFVKVNLQAINVGAMSVATLAAFTSALEGALQTSINASLPLGKTVAVSIAAGPKPAAAGPADATSQMVISSANGDVFIRPESSSDLAVPLMLGTDQGGLEVSRYAALRPAPTGIVFNAPANLRTLPSVIVNNLGGLTQGSIGSINLGAASTVTFNLQTTTPPNANARNFTDGSTSSPNGNSDGVREKVAVMAAALNNYAQLNPGFDFKAQVWGSRLAIIPISGGDNVIASFATGTTDIAGQFTRNVRYYSLGVSGTGAYQTPAGALASDGTAPLLSDYANAYDVVDKQVDLFNLLILPEDAGPGATPMKTVWGPASIFCQQRRAFLLMDAPADWTNVQQATAPGTGVSSLRTGLVRDHSAIFYPRLLINEDGREVKVGPSGSVAGLMARIDSNRGVWKAAAGTEADIRGIVGIERRFSDSENGVLNPKAINTLRVFPDGIVNWGARTMDGDDGFGSEWKYIPIRRLALFIEESLYRGTKWVVFEPNDEPLWAQIRLNIGAFMHNLFRQGAFQGKTPQEAYLVKCDSETTTQNDRNLGMVNILVGFAPLKPAEFVIIQIQQLAGQIQA